MALLEPTRLRLWRRKASVFENRLLAYHLLDTPEKCKSALARQCRIIDWWCTPKSFSKFKDECFLQSHGGTWLEWSGEVFYVPREEETVSCDPVPLWKFNMEGERQLDMPPKVDEIESLEQNAEALIYKVRAGSYDAKDVQVYMLARQARRSKYITTIPKEDPFHAYRGFYCDALDDGSMKFKHVQGYELVVPDVRLWEVTDAGFVCVSADLRELIIITEASSLDKQTSSTLVLWRYPMQMGSFNLGSLMEHVKLRACMDVLDRSLVLFLNQNASKTGSYCVMTLPIGGVVAPPKVCGLTLKLDHGAWSAGTVKDVFAWRGLLLVICSRNIFVVDSRTGRVLVRKSFGNELFNVIPVDPERDLFMLAASGNDCSVFRVTQPIGANGSIGWDLNFLWKDQNTRWVTISRDLHQFAYATDGRSWRVFSVPQLISAASKKPKSRRR